MYKEMSPEELALVFFDCYFKNVAKNAISNIHKAERVRDQYVQTDNGIIERVTTDQYPSDDQIIVVKELVCHIENTPLLNALQQLPNQECEALLLHFWGEQLDVDVAQYFAVSTRTIRSWRKKSLERLRGLMS